MGGDRVAWTGGNHPSALETLYACGQLGAIWVPVNARLTAPEAEYVLTHAAPFLARATQQGSRAYWVSQPITVGREDLLDLAVELHRHERAEPSITNHKINALRSNTSKVCVPSRMNIRLDEIG